MRKYINFVLNILGIALLIAVAYFLIKTFGFFGGIIVVGVIAWSAYMNEHHSPIVLYFKNAHKIHKR